MVSNSLQRYNKLLTYQRKSETFCAFSLFFFKNYQKMIPQGVMLTIFWNMQINLIIFCKNICIYQKKAVLLQAFL